jgi:hypothetical protein
MAGHGVCPWWVGGFLASPFRRLMQALAPIVAPYVHAGMTVLEPGPGMGFFTLDIARLVGPSGHVIAVDVQRQMIAGLRRRARRAGLPDFAVGRTLEKRRLRFLGLRGGRPARDSLLQSLSLTTKRVPDCGRDRPNPS